MAFSKKQVIQYITQRRQNDGGFHFANIEPSNGSDTFYAVATLTALGYEIDKPEGIYSFFDQLAQEKETFDLTNVYYAVETLACLNYDTVTFRNGLDKQDLAKEFDPDNKHKQVYVDSVSTLKSAFLVTSICKTLNIRLEDARIPEFIFSYRNRDGGFGQGGNSNIPDTYFALATLVNVGITGAPVTTRNYLLADGEDLPGSFLEYIYWNFKSLTLLDIKPVYAKRLIKYLPNYQRINGGFARSPFQGIPTFEDTYYAIVMIKELETLTGAKLLV